MRRICCIGQAFQQIFGYNALTIGTRCPQSQRKTIMKFIMDEEQRDAVEDVRPFEQIKREHFMRDLQPERELQETIQ